MLPINAVLPERGNVWSDIANSPSGVFCACEHTEGYGRESRREYIQFLRIAQGSQKELETYLLLAVRVGLASEEMITPILTECERVGKMLHRLIRSLQKT